MYFRPAFNGYMLWSSQCFSIIGYHFIHFEQYFERLIVKTTHCHFKNCFYVLLSFLLIVKAISRRISDCFLQCELQLILHTHHICFICSELCYIPGENVQRLRQMRWQITIPACLYASRNSNYLMLIIWKQILRSSVFFSSSPKEMRE